VERHTVTSVKQYKYALSISRTDHRVASSDGYRNIQSTKRLAPSYATEHQHPNRSSPRSLTECPFCV